MDMSELKRSSIEGLQLKLSALGIELDSMSFKEDLIFALLQWQSRQRGKILGEGTLEVFKEGFGLLRESIYNYEPSADDIYVSPSQIRSYGMRTGDTIRGEIRPPTKRERYYSLYKLESFNGMDFFDHRKMISFDDLTPLYPDTRFRLEFLPNKYSTRIIDLFCPIGKGQRALIVAPPKSGKTVLIQEIAESIAVNHPDVILLVLLVDERPEEVTDMKRSIRGEVIASTFDEPARRHIQVSEIVIEKAKRLVEMKRDVVILLDNITRLGRAYNAVIPSSGKVLSGGVDSNALQRPKRFFGAARNVEEGGSLTIISTALIDTGSKMDEVVFEEFKGTGNSEIVLDRKLMEKRIFPCLDVKKSGTRKEEHLINQSELNRIWILRQLLHAYNSMDAMEILLDHLKSHKTNFEFLEAMNK
ncbi:MAG: transcription termination factor Rho [Deltaproteobacteria bacterium]|nr:MAG: transcription termination factor Rho [Deltaproteobacteria bacterium]